MKNKTTKSSPSLGQPWNSIKESIITQEKKTSNYTEALISPCKSCSSSPCCSYLPLKTFEVNKLMDLDHARYLLNFRNIELGLSSGGQWSVYYTYPCRFLDRTSFKCTIHDQPEQPNICKTYNPYNCWYKKVCTSATSAIHIRIDRARLQYIIDKLEFDDNGVITKVPDWDLISQEVGAIMEEPEPFVEVDPSQDEAYTEWLKEGSASKPTPEDRQQLKYEAAYNPCDGCSAPCCETLIFPQETPTSFSNIDYIKFCLGYPGVELSVSDNMWSLVVKTTCRNLTDDKECSVYGMDERPLICKYYDQFKCTYKHEFLTPRPERTFRMKYKEFTSITDSFSYDQNGLLLGIPSVDEIRTEVESKLPALL